MNKTILIKMVVSLPVTLSVIILLHFAKIGSRINCCLRYGSQNKFLRASICCNIN